MKPKLPDDARADFKTVFAKELDCIRKWRANRLKSTEPAAGPLGPSADADALKLVGLSFSGGGIRSATFNLGILQSLARLKILRHIDYLSTVSGGGYIGAWLNAMIFRANGDIDVVEKGLDPDQVKTDALPQKAIAYLRAYSNYLTPRVSLLNADTWLLWTIWSRNTLLNLTILVACTAALILLARILGLGVYFPPGGVVLRGIEIASYVVFGLVAVVLGVNLAERGPGERTEKRRTDKWVQISIVAPALVGAVLVTLEIYGERRYTIWWHGLILAILFWVMQWCAGFQKCFELQHDKPWAKRVGRILQVLVAAASGYFTAWIFYGLVKLFNLGFNDGNQWPDAPWLFLTVGPPAVLTVLTLGVILNVGMLGRDIPDQKREWTGRLGACITIYSIGWLLVFGASFYAPLLLRQTLTWAKYTITGTWIAATIGSVLAAKSGKVAGNTTDNPGVSAKLMNFAAVVGPYVFIAGFVVAIAAGAHRLVTFPPSSTGTTQQAAAQTSPQVSNSNPQTVKVGPNQCTITVTLDSQCCCPAGSKSASEALTGTVNRYWQEMNSQVFFTVLGALWEWDSSKLDDWYKGLVDIFLLCSLIALIMSWRVDINEFSLHHFYKNRLVRCYLGASREQGERHPNPFTKFDEKDDVRLDQLNEDKFSGPFPIINATLNLSSGANLAWQQRQSSSFIFTPVYSGYDTGGDSSGTSAARRMRAAAEQSGYIPTALVSHTKDGGIMLGTTVAISGAAANPNQCYHTSTAVAFLMTVFNVRLGWWLGNPTQSAAERSGPPFGLPYTMMELFGSTDATNNYVNLSDGGHFDNMGLYELVRRRCKYIIVCDAEQDDMLSFGGLSTAIRMCRTDFGVEITLEFDDIERKPENKHECFSKRHWATGIITYPPAVAGGQRPVGKLIYIKSSLTGNEPVDVLGYHKSVPIFPHESTADQWFDESQFESYRRLGLHIADTVFHHPKDTRIEGGKETFFEGLDPESSDEPIFRNR